MSEDLRQKILHYSVPLRSDDVEVLPTAKTDIDRYKKNGFIRNGQFIQGAEYLSLKRRVKEGTEFKGYLGDFDLTAFEYDKFKLKRIKKDHEMKEIVPPSPKSMKKNIFEEKTPLLGLSSGGRYVHRLECAYVCMQLHVHNY